MALLLNAVVIFSVVLIILSICSKSFAVPTGIAEVLKVNDTSFIIMVLTQPVGNDIVVDGGGGREKASQRVKRQSGGSQFEKSATMSQKKLMQLYLQMFKNIIAGKNIGGSHPMHPGAVKPIVQLFKDKVVAFFFPEVGEEKV